MGKTQIHKNAPFQAYSRIVEGALAYVTIFTTVGERPLSPSWSRPGTKHRGSRDLGANRQRFVLLGAEKKNQHYPTVAFSYAA